MSRTYIIDSLRRTVANRSGLICEYCTIPEFSSLVGFQCDHIISEKLGGETNADNLAYCCPFCNLYKGANISSFAGNPPKNTPLFNPRTDLWSDHFYYAEDGQLQSLTDVGTGTIFVLKINMIDRVIDRKALFEAGVMKV